MFRNLNRQAIAGFIVCVFLATGAFFMANVQLPEWSHYLSAANVLLFALPSFWALKMWLAWQKAIALIVILSTYALSIETIAILTGFPYGHFGYSEHLGFKIFGEVPWTIAFAWTPLVLCAYAAARSLFVSRLRRIVFSTFLLVAFDMVIDPGAVLLGFWQYPNGGVFYGVPFSNFLGWLVSGAIGSLILETAVSYFRPFLPPPVQLGSSAFFILVFWTSLAAFAGLGVPAAIGGAFALAMYLWYRRSYYAFDEMVVLVDENNIPIGTARKRETHNSDTMLHRAFSVFIFNSNGEVLLQRRAYSKQTWPGIWSNSCCGHVMLNESPEQAAARRLDFELGLRNIVLTMALPDYRYRAEKDGIVENEICPVLFGFSDSAPDPNPNEVAEFEWKNWDSFLAEIEGREIEFTPWAVEEARLLSQSEELLSALGRQRLRAAA